MQTLFRITIMTPTANIDRGVWADGYEYSNDGTITFFNLEEGDERRPIGVYPVNGIFISSIQTYEEYTNAKKLNAHKF